MKKLISLVLILCMTCMLIPAVAEESITGVWYGRFMGLEMILTLNEDGTASMNMPDMGMEQSGSWALDGENLAVTMVNDGEESTEHGTFVDGKLTLMNGEMPIEFGREPVEAPTVAEVNPDAAAEDFEGSWAINRVSMAGVTMDAAAAGMGETVLTIENSAIALTGAPEALSFFLGDGAFQLEYADGALIRSIDIPNDAEPMKLEIRAELLQDGMLALTIDIADNATVLYFDKAAAEEAPAA